MRVPSRTFVAALSFVCLAALTAACGSKQTPAQVPVPATATQPTQAQAPTAPPPLPVKDASPPDKTSDCALIAAPGQPIATVALTERIDPSNAPRPSNDSEQLLFRQIYETLVRLDCQGLVRPGLAESWKLDTDGRTWILTLREDARFTDGTVVTAANIRDAWMRGGELLPHVDRLVHSVVAVTGREVAIALKSARVDMPAPLAHVDLAVAKAVAGSRWPLGTRTDGAAPEPSASADVTGSAITVNRANLPSIRFLAVPGDPRDALDKGADLLVTRDPAALDYAATLLPYQSVPLEWQRVHVLVTPGRTQDAPSMPTPNDAARQALADDAVRGEARAAVGPFWWQALDSCEVAPAPPRPNAALTPRIVYDVRDRASGDLANRLVGLSQGARGAALRSVLRQAVALAGPSLAATRQRGRDAGYIFSLDRRPIDPCRDIHVLIDGARWLDPEAIVPLVETRMRAILRRGTSGVSVDWDGGLRIE